MNPIILKAMGADLNPPPLSDETSKLVQLRNELTRLGVAAGLRDNMSALMVRPSRGMPIWVFVGYGGQYFSWQSAEKRHPVSDVAGAARALVEYIDR
ncbi:hypothetical protein Sru01_46420 [Sphaerisporangium rufum]|uniref:Uncharacterized protein n=1 Tax=Sphaerisporangium rufum TaxID=1381558 RepID=A0A919R7H9_9ACTN|nr:hypothetical protein [Sphaerisporangium rufum]GII79660.1 hypothetical protein Sru01_46420 [Sphaerisporangium rufum]